MVRSSRFKRITRPTMPVTRFVYLTIPQRDLVVLNINDGETHFRHQVNRDQLLKLNEQIVDIIIKNKFDDDGTQLVLSLEKTATL